MFARAHRRFGKRGAHRPLAWLPSGAGDPLKDDPADRGKVAQRAGVPLGVANGVKSTMLSFYKSEKKGRDKKPAPPGPLQGEVATLH